VENAHPGILGVSHNRPGPPPERISAGLAMMSENEADGSRMLGGGVNCEAKDERTWALK
jgi:hypothetical protein